MRRKLFGNAIAFALAILALAAAGCAPTGENSRGSRDGKAEEPLHIANQSAATTAAPSDTSASGDIVYVRPTGVAGGREGGGTRGAVTIGLFALLPEDHAALTTRDQPTLYWYVAEPTTARVDVVVNHEQDEKPLLEKTLSGPFGAGIHAVDFADLGVKLQPRAVYKWYVVIPDPLRSSQDSFAGGAIQRVTPSAELAMALAQAKPGERAAVFARHGIWCDALAELVRGLSTNPNDAELQRKQAALLSQVGLSGISGVPVPDPATQTP